MSAITAATAEGTLDPAVHPHRRYNPLTGRWVIVSPQRTKRPWNGATSHTVVERPSYEPDCYLCPTNSRANDSTNPAYTGTFVFGNDFAALGDAPGAVDDPTSWFRHQPARGECRVLCFSPNHRLTLAGMSHAELVSVVDLWCDQTTELESRWRWVQIFETRGEICGASNPHPHGQLWASEFLPNEAASEAHHQERYHRTHRRHLLLDYLHSERAAGERVVIDNGTWVVVVPWWAYWPYETLVLPSRHIPSFSDLTTDDRDGLAATLKQLLGGYDRVFDTPFPYCSGWHSAGRPDRPYWQLHAHYYPSLLRSADVAKIPASYEVLAEHQRDLTPEYAAERLRQTLRP